MNAEDENRTICFCHCVTFGELKAAIRGGCATLAQIKDQTRASTGCSGCEVEVEEILESEKAKSSAQVG